MIRGVMSILVLLVSGISIAQRPSLTLTAQGVEKIKSGLGNTPIFDKKLAEIQKGVDQQIEQGIDVPIPKDMAGAYTHQQHKANYKVMYESGNLYQITGQEKYASFVKDMLLQYAEMYPGLPLHPTQKSYATGKIFWQCLNDANWLVFTSQAYDCIFDYLTTDERTLLEQDLFIPFADFLSEGNPRFFNRIHNHCTWATAAVGLMALAMKNDTLLDKALYGLKDDGIIVDELKNKSGYVVKDGVRQTGFLAQLDYSFSPDGYFSEGPYYQRYAIFPFLVFSHALNNNKPELKIFEYRDQILLKATETLLELTDQHGEFFPINDSQKGMSYKAYEVVTAVDLMCYMKDGNAQLLEWARQQEEVAFNETGFYVAQKLKEQQPKQPIKRSVHLADGVNGDEGGIAVLRQGGSELFFKFSTQGMGHGHFDRLSYSLTDKAGETIQDYGAVRWVNVDQKGGGRYLPENKTFGKQTIGHNTIVINKTSQYEAKVKKAEKHAPEFYHKDFSQPNFKIISAIENNAYPNVDLQRVVILFEDTSFFEPLLLDIFAFNAPEKVTVDLPLWYKGVPMETSFDCPKNKTGMQSLGQSNGYQHIWEESICSLSEKNFQFNWFGNQRFYTLTGTNESSDQIIMGRAGANDPNYNLRSDPVFIQRKNGSEKSVFFNIIESHGSYNTTTERPMNPYSQIQDSKVEYKDENYVVCSFSNETHQWSVCYSLTDNDPRSEHELEIYKDIYKWQGVYKFEKSKI